MYSPVTGTGAGSAPVVNLTWPFLDKDHVKASVDGALVGFTWTGAAQVTFTTAAASGAAWRVYRQTPTDPLVDFTDGAVLTAADLDKAQTQRQYLEEELQNLVGGAIQFADGVGQALDRDAYKGKFLAVDAGGNVIPSSGTGADAGLRTDLAGTSGASMLGLLDGTSLSENILTVARRLRYGARSRARTLREARDMAANIHTLIVGYAKTAGTTGGQGKTEYLVTVAGMDPTIGGAYPDPGIGGAGTYAWCKAQAAANGGGRIIFYPTGHWDLIVEDNVQNRHDIGQDNLTVIAPGRNVIFWHVSLTGSTVVKNQNMIHAYLEYATLPGPMSGDFDGSGEKAEIGLVSVFPQNINKQAWIGCTWNRASDGAWDIASTGFTTASSAAYVTNQDFLFRNIDECSLLGAISDTTTVNDTRKLFVTMFSGVYDGCGQRQPKVLGLAMVDVANVYTQAVPWRRDQPAPVAEYGAVSGVEVQNGGWALARGYFFTALDGLTHEATKLVANPVSGETGAVRIMDYAGEYAATFPTANSNLVPDPPYLSSLPHTPVPATGPSREAWIKARWLAVGAGPDAAPEGWFGYDPTSTEYPNQQTVVRRRGPSGAFVVGRDLRIDAAAEIPAYQGSKDAATLEAITRGYTRTVGFTQGKATLAALGATMLDMANADSSYFTVQGNGGAGVIEDIIRTDGVLLSDGTTLRLQGSASAPITLRSAKSITATANATTDVITATAHGKTVSGFQVMVSNSGGALPAGLSSSVVYYGIYVDANSFKLALSYADAIAGTAVNFTDAGTGTHTATLGSLNLPGSADIVLNSSSKIAILELNTGNGRFSNAGGLVPLTGSKSWDWASLATATQQSTTVTVTGAVVGDFVMTPSMSVALSGTRLWGEVTAPDTVTVYQRNDTGGAVDVISGTLKVQVWKS
jgi:hypothetical protein